MQERLSTCTLVCQTWAAAGAGASKVLAVQLRSQAQADNLTAWLAQHGSAIEQLSVATDHQVSTGLDACASVRGALQMVGCVARHPSPGE